MRTIVVLEQGGGVDLNAFEADVEWARGRGATIERFDIGTQPHCVLAYPAALVAVTHGQGALPVILLDGELVLQGRYPSRKELAGWAGVVMGSAFRLDDACGASGCCC